MSDKQGRYGILLTPKYHSGTYNAPRPTLLGAWDWPHVLRFASREAAQAYIEGCYAETDTYMLSHGEYARPDLDAVEIGVDVHLDRYGDLVEETQ